MSSVIKPLLPLIFMGAFFVNAQTSLPIPENITAAYAKGTRSTNGEPGAHYWQNRADYTIKINFDPASRLLNGVVSINYTNNSPDTLNQVAFKLYPNLYKKGSIRNMPVLPADITDGVQIKQLSINQQVQNESQWTIDGTNMTLQTPAILPKQSVHFDITYAYTLNKTSHIRTGQVDSGAFFIAYFFPRVAVYDDIDGWNQNH